jgi:hypothetical protein
MAGMAVAMMVKSREARKMAKTKPTSTSTKRDFDKSICGFSSWSDGGEEEGFGSFSGSMVLFDAMSMEGMGVWRRHFGEQVLETTLSALALAHKSASTGRTSRIDVARIEIIVARCLRGTPDAKADVRDSHTMNIFSA